MARIDLEQVLGPVLMDTWGETVTCLPIVSQPAQPAFDVTAVFDAEHEVILEHIKDSEIDAAGHSTTMPVVTVRLSDFAVAPKMGDQFTIRSQVYIVYDPQPDGEGFADLVLRKQI